MKRIIIIRKELTTYCTVHDLPDEEADQFLAGEHEDKLEDMCRASEANWTDATDPEFEVEEAEFQEEAPEGRYDFIQATIWGTTLVWTYRLSNSNEPGRTVHPGSITDKTMEEEILNLTVKALNVKEDQRSIIDIVWE